MSKYYGKTSHGQVKIQTLDDNGIMVLVPISTTHQGIGLGHIYLRLGRYEAEEMSRMLKAAAESLDQ